MSRPKRVVALQTGHLLSARWPEQHPSPLSVTSLISRARGCSLQTAGLPSLQHPSPPGSTHAQFLFPCQAAESSAVWDSSKSSASEKREHMSIHYIFIHTLRHVPTPETHTVCSDFSLQHVLQICSPPPLFPRFALSGSCLREMLLTVNWKR